MNGPVESELKIPVESLEGVRERLRTVGAELLAARDHEVNTLFDHPDRRLTSSGHALRLRRSEGRWVVTLKGPVRYDSGVKEREELETEVADGEVVVAILARLGLGPARRYEKYRERWLLGEVEVALDHTPMGCFVELEGPREALAEAARAIGLEPGRSLHGSYVSLWSEHREAHPELELPEDMVFEG